VGRSVVHDYFLKGFAPRIWAEVHVTLKATLAGPIRFLSSDLLEGRGPATRGTRVACLINLRRARGGGSCLHESTEPAAFVSRIEYSAGARRARAVEA